MLNLLWIAEYSDGHVTKRKPATYATLKRTNLKKFSLIDKNADVKLTVNLEDGDVLFYRRRTFRVGTPLQYSIYLLGHRKRTADGKVKNRILILKSDGSIIEDNIFRNEWFEPAWFPAEQV